MGNCLLLLGLKKEKRPVTLLLVGLDSAGKTTAAKGIVGDPVEDVAPTVGFAPEYLEYRGCEVTIYDLGGGAKIRPVWNKYFSEVHGIIYVVDSTANNRIGECREVLTTLLANRKIAGKPVLILANKQDVDGALDEIDLVESLKVEEIVNRYKCPTRVETCSALATKNRKPDKPVADGFRWLVDTIVVHYKEINARVTKDVEREKAEQRREVEERKERLKQLRMQREIMSGGRRSEIPPPPPPLTSSSSSSSSSSPVVTKAEVVVREEKEEEEEVEKNVSLSSSAGSKIPNGSLPQAKNIRTVSERQELKELGFESSGENCVSSSSSSSSSLVKDTATTRSPRHAAPPSSPPPQSLPPTTSTPSPPPPAPPHRVILVRESSPPNLTTTTTTTTTTATTTNNGSSSPSSTSETSAGHHASRLDLSSERRQSECIPIDSDDEMFDLPPPPLPGSPLLLLHPHHHHLHHNNYLHHREKEQLSPLSPPSSSSQGNSAKANIINNNINNNNNSASAASLELESSSKPNKKKSFLKRYHKTAPLVPRDQEVPPQQA